MHNNNYILKDENAVFYECGYSCDHAIYLRLGEEAYFITDGRYTIDAKEHVQGATVIEERNLLVKAMELLVEKEIQELLLDPQEWNILEYEKLQILDITYIHEPQYSQKKRIIKADEEIEKLSRAAQIGADCFDEVALYVAKNGATQSEKYLFFQSKVILSDKDERALSFDPIVALNKSSAKPHAVPCDTQAQNGDILLFDAGVKYERYCSDRTRTAQIDTQMHFDKQNQHFSNPKHQEIYDIVLKAQLAAIEKVRPGVLAKEIDKAARDVITNAGYGDAFVHSTGHGVGLDIHELPVISASSESVLEEGMVFTIEPGIYLEDAFGVRIEDTVVVTHEGVRIL